MQDKLKKISIKDVNRQNDRSTKKGLRLESGADRLATEVNFYMIIDDQNVSVGNTCSQRFTRELSSRLESKSLIPPKEGDSPSPDGTNKP